MQNVFVYQNDTEDNDKCEGRQVLVLKFFLLRIFLLSIKCSSHGSESFEAQCSYISENDLIVTGSLTQNYY